jgi:uncharacterized protein YjeT (DUF2065 family)
MLHELLIALGLVLVIEGIVPFLNPAGFRRLLLMAAQFDDATVRFVGITSMVSGVLLLYIVN